MESWLNKQMSHNISQFEKAMEIHYPESKTYTQDARSFVKRIVDDCNYLRAVELASIEQQLPDNASVLDLAGGIGWLSAHMSKVTKIKKIYIVDSCKHYLNNLLPQVVDILGGNKQKIFPIEGLFTPLYFESNSLDCVMVSSSLHHADNLEEVLVEIRRVLKKGGTLFILNETPRGHMKYAFNVCKVFLRIIYDSLTKNYRKRSTYISSSGMLDDPYLGDKQYPLWYWSTSIRAAGFSLERIINTRLSTVKDRKGPFLTHFICKN